MSIPIPKDGWINREGSEKEQDPEIVYAVSWIEVEFGQRDEGHNLYINLDDCIKDTREGSRNGAYEGGGGYLGPKRPLNYTIVPFSCLEEKYKEELRDSGKTGTKNHWQPMFKGKTVYIK